MDVSHFAEALRGWADEHRLTNEAYSAWEEWLDTRGGSIGGFAKAEISAKPHRQALVFRTWTGESELVVETCLILSVFSRRCPFGDFKLLTGLDGRRRGIQVELGREVQFEGLGGEVWRFHE